MTTYAFKGDAAGMPFVSPNHCPFQKEVNIPNLITYGGLVDTSGNDSSLPSTGFAASDVLRVFDVPKGFVLRMAGVQVLTAEGAACTADLGCNSATQTHLLTADANGIMDTLNLNSATWQINLIADVQLGGSTYEGLVFVTDGTIDITFGSANTNTAVFKVFCHGFFVDPLTS